MSWLRKYFPRTYFARRNLSRARARTVLAVLVVAVGGLGIFGSSFETSQQQNLGDVANKVEVTAPSEGFPPPEDPVPLDERRLETIESIAGDSEMTVLRERPASGRLGNSNVTAVAGVVNLSVAFTITEGTVPDDWRKGVVIDSQTSSFLQISVGDPVRVNGRLYEVIAVAGELPRGVDVLLPMALVEPTDETRYSTVIIYADDAVEADQIADELDRELNEGLDNREEFEIDNREADAVSIQQQFTSTSQFLIGIGSVSLLIAGISITNVQLMSARERRREIGVLRAIGFSQLDILAIMLIEAVMMGLVAAVVGVLGSVAAGAVINDLLLNDPAAFQPDTTRNLLVAFAFGVLVTLAAGIYPAWTAARERPVDALRD